MKRSTYHFFMNDTRKIPVVNTDEIGIANSISIEQKTSSSREVDVFYKSYES
jgi:hypothetical protein